MSAIPEGYTIRLYQSSDLAEIVQIERAAFGRDAWGVRDFLTLFQTSTTQTLIAETGSKVVGYVVGQGADERGYIVTIAVHPDHQGRGVGRALLDLAMDWLIEQGAASLRLHVSASNRAAMRLYESEGFRSIRTIPGYYADGSTAFLMERQAHP